MADLAYGRVYAMNKIEARKLLIQTWQETKSIRATARLWHTSPQTVRKWAAVSWRKAWRVSAIVPVALTTRRAGPHRR